MKKIFLILSIIILLAIVYLVIINFNNYASLNILTANIVEPKALHGWTQNGFYLGKEIRLSTYTVLILLGGIFTGAGTVYMFYDATKDKVKAYQRELEKTSISGSNNASRVEVLEAKIKTLEKAFSAVIDERQKLEVQIKSLNAELDNINKDKEVIKIKLQIWRTLAIRKSFSFSGKSKESKISNKVFRICSAFSLCS